MLKLGTILSLLLVSSSAAATNTGPSADAAITNAKQAVAERMPNPYAAQFRNVSAYRPDTSIREPQAVCGEVTVRDGFDRYNGYRSFVWVAAYSSSDRGTAFIGSEANGYRSLCRNAMR
jgi:hypothetical protein